ncbi:TonB-dependent receptor [Porphyromonas pogonae]|uniref:TonB-dependent receptor n=1 Tax=Porphyromonas pogonae TaxID=867595 RepID=UPI002E777BFE|nr:TonB-dependent receptor [Porphyromonas pogonae]
MKQKLHRILLFILAINVSSLMMYAQVTTSGITGKVTDKSKETLIGASVQAIHIPSGTKYGASTNNDGNYSIVGMRPGGPYQIEITYVGYEKRVISNVQLQLGETSVYDIVLNDNSTQLEQVVITGKKVSQFNSQKTGAASNFSRKVIESTPSISRSIFDITRLTPQATQSGSGTSFGGANNRYNSFQIDGTVNNDVFGLSASGTNGGQSGANPISLDAIEEVQVVIAPFDVRQSGFTGGGVNAITKSGTNTFHGSVYDFYNNQNFIGSTAGTQEDIDKNSTSKKREKYEKQHDNTVGVTIGGPIVRNKLFFFGSYENVKEVRPTSYNLGSGSTIKTEEAEAVANKLKQLANGYDGGGYAPMNIDTKSDKVLARIDWNMTNSTKLTARYSYLKASRQNFSNSRYSLRFNDNGFIMNNKTHSAVVELNSRFSDKVSNEFRASYTGVRDSRTPQGHPFPYTKVELGSNRAIEFGTERYSAANTLDQDSYTVSDNLSFFLGNHTLVVGTHNEFFKFKNLFIRDNYGAYIYKSLDDFLSVGTAKEVAPREYNYSFSIESVTGSKRWAPTFSAAQFGLYAQDEWRVNDNLRLTYGVRVDLPVFFDKPTANDKFNATDISKEFEVRTDQMPKTQPLFSPRLGFRYKVDDTGNLIRGGVGVFTGRIPFVWISNSFSNSGVEYSRTQLLEKSGFPADFKYSTDPTKQYLPKGSLPTEIDVISKNFKFPQVFKANLAFDANLPGGIKATLEGMFSKSFNNVYYKNLVNKYSGKQLNLFGDDRPMYESRPNTDEYNAGIIYLENTNKGYSYNLTAKLNKDFNFGLSAMIAYTYGESMGVNDGTSSQAQSNWKYNEVYGGDQFPDLSFTDFDIRHRIVGSLNYRVEYAKHFATTFSLLYNGQSGSPYTMTYKGDVNGDGQYNDLMYIPTRDEIQKMNFVPILAKDKKTVIATPDQQREDLNKFIDGDDYLKFNRGTYSRRNALRSMFEHHFDLHLAQDFYFNVGGQRHTLQITGDILNVGNLLNRAWGKYYTPGYGFNNMVYMKGDKFQFNAPEGDLVGYSDFLSRWRAQIGVKYIF